MRKRGDMAFPITGRGSMRDAAHAALALLLLLGGGCAPRGPGGFSFPPMPFAFARTLISTGWILAV